MHDPDAVDAIIKWVAVALQVIGLILLVLGVAVVHSWLERATEAAAEATRAASTDGGHCALSRLVAGGPAVAVA
jgi:hypothetical protein